MLNEVHRLLHIYYTIPLTSATSERTFSGLRRLKTYLRSTMTQKRLNHLHILHTHQQHTDNLSLLKVAMDFVVKNNRRNQFFGQYILCQCIILIAFFLIFLISIIILYSPLKLKYVPPPMYQRYIKK